MSSRFDTVCTSVMDRLSYKILWIVTNHAGQGLKKQQQNQQTDRVLQKQSYYDHGTKDVSNALSFNFWIRTAFLIRVITHFYRATLCVRAVFAVARCLSVRSVTLVYCIETAEDIVEIFSRPGSPIILVFFLAPAPIPNSKGNPFNGGANTRGGKNWRFSTEIAVYLGNGAR